MLAPIHGGPDSPGVLGESLGGPVQLEHGPDDAAEDVGRQVLDRHGEERGQQLRDEGLPAAVLGNQVLKQSNLLNISDQISLNTPTITVQYCRIQFIMPTGHVK